MHHVANVANVDDVDDVANESNDAYDAYEANEADAAYGPCVAAILKCILNVYHNFDQVYYCTKKHSFDVPVILAPLCLVTFIHVECIDLS